MPASYTPLGFILQATGENESTWGAFLNSGGLSLIDDAIRSRIAFALSGSKTLTSTNGTDTEARKAILHITGGTGGAVTIPNYSKVYVVINEASGSVIITAGGATTATVTGGETTLVVSDGSNVRTLGIGGLSLKQYIDAQAFAETNLPGITPGTAGQVVGNDGENAMWVWSGLSTSYSVSTAVTVQLDNDVAPIVRVTPTAANVSVELPDATTLTQRGREYEVSNAGNYPLGVRNYDGVLLSVVPPRGAALVVAADISTAAGVWDVTNTGELGVMVWPSAVLVAESSAGADVQALTTDKAIVVWSTGAAIRAAVVSRSGTTLTLGTPITVAGEAASAPKVAALSATGAAMVWMKDGADDVRAAALSISGTTVTTGSVATVVSGGQYNAQVAAAALDSTRAVFSYSVFTGTTAVAVASVTGTAISVGSPVGLSGTGGAAAAVAALGSGSFLAYATSNLTACSTSGTTVTAGAAFSIALGSVTLTASSTGKVLAVGQASDVDRSAIVSGSGSTISAVSGLRAIPGAPVGGYVAATFGSALLFLGSAGGGKLGRLISDRLSVFMEAQMDHDLPSMSGSPTTVTAASVNEGVGVLVGGTSANLYAALIEVIK